MIGFLRRVIKRQKVIFGIIAGLVIIVGILALSNGNGNSGEVLSVERGTVVQSVSVTGKIQAISNVDLSFQKSGRVASIPVKVGDRVRNGQALASLDTSELRAQLNDALANVDVQKAKLDEIKIGSRTEDIKIREAELAKAAQDLANYYGTVLNISNDAYNKADDALHNQLDALFNNDENMNPTLTFDLNNSQLKTKIETDRLVLGLELKDWNKKLLEVSVNSNEQNLGALLDFQKTFLSELQGFLNNVFQALNSSISLSASTLETYKANLDTARANINTAIASVLGRIQDISAQRIVVQKAEYQLDLQRAGSTKEQIAAQEAQVKQAEAKVQIIEAQINQNIVFAPFSGLIAKQDLEVGEVATANSPFISLISDDNLEVEANVPEVNIGKVLVGNATKIKLDAFSDEVFDGKVFYVEPAETLVEGVVNYKIEVSFDKPDKRIRSGLTADIEILTATKENVLLVPSFAIVSADGKNFVEKVVRRKAELVEVVLGLKGTDGNVEIVSGLNEGDQILAREE